MTPSVVPDSVQIKIILGPGFFSRYLIFVCRLCIYHVTRMSQERLARQAVLGTPTGNRLKGRLKARWHDYTSSSA